MSNVDTFLANMRHAIRNRETVTIGGGQFSPAELAEVVSLLSVQQAEPVVWECKAGGLRPLTQTQYQNQTDAIKRHYSRIAPQPLPPGYKLVPVEALKRWQSAFAEEISAWDINPPLHHVKTSHDEIVAMLAAAPAPAEKPADLQLEHLVKVGWRYRQRNDLQWQLTEREDVACHPVNEWEPVLVARNLEPIEGDKLPPVGSRVFILHGRDDQAHACTVTGYYAWGDLAGNKRLHRVFVRLVYEGTDSEQVRMLCDCYPTAEAAHVAQKLKGGA